jgi:hypothetical protein
MISENLRNSFKNGLLNPSSRRPTIKCSTRCVSRLALVDYATLDLRSFGVNENQKDTPEIADFSLICLVYKWFYQLGREASKGARQRKTADAVIVHGRL